MVEEIPGLPRKRRRLDSPSEPLTTASTESQTEPPKQDEEFWYEDGNIILEAGNTQFRVYKGILSERSPVFADMFTLPQPSLESWASSKQLPSCPVVTLQGESPEDLRHFLRVLLPNWKDGSSFRVGGAPSFHSLSACIRLGHKYQIENLVQTCLEVLSEYFSPCLETWSDAWYNSDLLSDHSIGVVNLARLVGDCDDVLLTSLVACCSLLREQLLHGYKHEDGTVERLSEPDIMLCLNAKQRLAEERIAIILYAFNSTFEMHFYDECDSDSRVCNYTVQDLLHSYMEFPQDLVKPEPYSSFPFTFNRSQWVPGNDDDICTTCQARLIQRFRDRHVDSWKQLPDIIPIGVRKADWAQRAC